MAKRKYRIVTDNYCGFEAQIKLRILPIWREIYYVNSSSSIEQARKLIEYHKQGLSKYGKQRPGGVVEYL